MQNGRDTALAAQVQIDDVRRGIERLEERIHETETRLARLEGRAEERDERTLRTAEQRALRMRRELATKIIAGTVTVALAVVSAIVSIVTAARC